jgi:hypothetical protein
LSDAFISFIFDLQMVFLIIGAAMIAAGYSKALPAGSKCESSLIFYCKKQII